MMTETRYSFQVKREHRFDIDVDYYRIVWEKRVIAIIFATTTRMMKPVAKTRTQGRNNQNKCCKRPVHKYDSGVGVYNTYNINVLGSNRCNLVFYSRHDHLAPDWECTLHTIVHPATHTFEQNTILIINNNTYLNTVNGVSHE